MFKATWDRRGKGGRERGRERKEWGGRIGSKSKVSPYLEVALGLVASRILRNVGKRVRRAIDVELGRDDRGDDGDGTGAVLGCQRRDIQAGGVNGLLVEG